MLKSKHAYKHEDMNREDLSVVGALLSDPIAWHYGLGIGSAAGIAAGTIYPALARLERSGWLESRWDQPGPSAPRRRLYRLTGVGQRCAVAALAQHQAPSRAPKRRRFGFGFGAPRSLGELG